MTPKTQGFKGEYIVILDDDSTVHLLIEKSLGIKAASFYSSEELLKNVDELQPIAAFIDIHLGKGSNGLKAIPKLREKWPYCPLLVITADPNEDTVCEALNCGADDFLLKPIRPKELIARMQARLVDQSEKQGKHVMGFDDVEIDLSHRALRGPKGEHYLSPTECNLLLALIQGKGTTLSRSALKNRCWDHITVSDNALDRKVYELRRALEQVGSRLNIATAYGVGFNLERHITRPVEVEARRQHV